MHASMGMYDVWLDSALQSMYITCVHLTDLLYKLYLGSGGYHWSSLWSLVNKYTSSWCAVCCVVMLGNTYIWPCQCWFWQAISTRTSILDIRLCHLFLIVVTISLMGHLLGHRAHVSAYNGVSTAYNCDLILISFCTRPTMYSFLNRDGLHYTLQSVCIWFVVTLLTVYLI